MFNFLKGKKTEITFTFDRATPVYVPGDTVGITVQIEPDKDMKLQGARFRLTGTELYCYTTEETRQDSDGKWETHQVDRWVQNEFFIGEEVFLRETILPNGKPQQYTFQYTLPLECLPSVKGEILKVEWKASVKLDRKLAGDIQEEAPLTVIWPAPGVDVQPGNYGQSSEPYEADMNFILPGLEAVLNQPYGGQLRVLPHKNFDASEVRLELVHYENVPYDKGNHVEKVDKVILAKGAKFEAGKEQVFLFQAPFLADAPPSLETENGTLTWTLKGVLARRLRKDTLVEQSILLYPIRG